MEEKKNEQQNTLKNSENLPPQTSPVKPKANPVTIASLAIAAVSVVAAIAIVVGGLGKNNEEVHIHSYGEWSVVKEATCETNGIKERFCNCGEKQTDTVYSQGHEFGTWNVVYEATCATEGKERRECSCGEREERSIDKIKTHIEVIDASVAPTCVKTGLTEGKHCSVCKTVLEEQTELPLEPHTYDDEYDANCNVCDFARVPSCRHDNTAVLEAKKATCTASGLTEGKKCISCEEILIPQTKIDPKGHTEGQWITDRNPTCTVNGTKHQECSVCNASIKEETIPLTGHTEGAWVTEKNPTCTTEGSKYKKCIVCEEKIRVESIGANGHSGGEWIYDVLPTCTAGGKRHKTCTVCITVIDQEVVPEKGHNYSDGSCTRCGAADPYPGAIRIYSYSDLVNMRNDLSATYVLMNDIDCQGFSLVPVGSNESSAFTGLFDGQGYTISNFVSSNADNVGVFGYNRGTVRNLNVKDFTYDVSAVSSNTVNIGGIVGFNAGLIEQCAVFNGDISATMDNTCRGGLICGYNTGNVLNCFSSGSVYLTHKSSGNKWVTCGGIAAGNEGRIENCCVNVTLYAYGIYRYQAAAKDPKGEAALICATNEKKGSVSNCFVMGSVTQGNNRQGDICGRNDGTITNCYRDSNIVLGGSGKKFEYATSQSLSNLSKSTFYSVNLGWDSDIWDFSNVNLSNKVYPTLKQN